MLEITESAINQIVQYFKDKKPSPVRVFLNQSG